MELTDMGVTMKKAAPSKTEMDIPDYFFAALQQQPGALEVFENRPRHLERNTSHGLLKLKPKLPETKE